MSKRVELMVEDRALGGPTRKALLKAMSDHASDDGRGVYPSLATLAKATDISRRQVIRLLQDFLDERLIEITGKQPCDRGGSTNEYRICLDALSALPLARDPIELVTSGHQCQNVTSDQPSPAPKRHPLQSVVKKGYAANDSGEKLSPVPDRHPNTDSTIHVLLYGKDWEPDAEDFAEGARRGLNEREVRAVGKRHSEWLSDRELWEQLKPLVFWRRGFHRQLDRVASDPEQLAYFAREAAATAPLMTVALPTAPAWWAEAAAKLFTRFPREYASYWGQCIPIGDDPRALRPATGTAADWCERNSEMAEHVVGFRINFERPGRRAA